MCLYDYISFLEHFFFSILYFWFIIYNELNNLVVLHFIWIIFNIRFSQKIASQILLIMRFFFFFKFISVLLIISVCTRAGFQITLIFISSSNISQIFKIHPYLRMRQWKGCWDLSASQWVLLTGRKGLGTGVGQLIPNRIQRL